ncbi:MAG: protease-associated domain-containing protein, partial [Hyphococcus sp.]
MKPVTSLRAYALSAVFCLSACAAPHGKPDGAWEATQAAALVDASASAPERLEADVLYLADDARAGREAGTPGYRQAADYVAARMEAIGLEPAGTDGWFQEVPLISSQAVVDQAALTVTSPGGAQTVLRNLKDFRLYTPTDADSFSIENAPAVFVGHGVHAPDRGHDDLAGMDLDGKVVVYFGGAPDTFQTEERAHFGSGSQKFKAFSD